MGYPWVGTDMVRMEYDMLLTTLANPFVYDQQRTVNIILVLSSFI